MKKKEEKNIDRIKMWQGKELKIGTWNVQRANLTRSCFGFITQKSIKKDWDLGLVTEIDARLEGLREYHHQKRDRFLVHSKKVRVLRNLDAFNIWNKQGRKKLITERLVLVKIDNVNYISTYFPVQGSEGYGQILQEIRNTLETIIHGQAKNEVVIIGGDFNVQIGTGNENNGNQGMSTINQQGRELLDWLAENDLCWVNSLYTHSGRGTWKHPGSEQWYELDGFVTRTNHCHGVQESTDWQPPRII